MNPNIEILELKRKLDEANKRLELTNTKIKDLVTGQQLTDEELQEHHDPANPSAMIEYATKFKQDQEGKFNAIIDEINNSTTQYMETAYSNDEITLQTELAKYAVANNSDLTYDKLTKDTPARIMEKFKSGELKSYEDLFKTVELYHQSTGVYTPTAPPAGGSGDMPPTAGQQQTTIENVSGSPDEVLC